MKSARRVLAFFDQPQNRIRFGYGSAERIKVNGRNTDFPENGGPSTGA